MPEILSATASPSLGSITPSGYYLRTPYVAQTTGSVSTGFVRVSPIYVGRALSVDRIAVDVTTAGSAGAVVRLGIYSSNTSGFPSALLLDAGTVAADGATGVATITISQALSVGVWWVAACTQVAASTLRVISGSGAVVVPSSETNPFSDNAVGYRDAGGVTGGLPSTFTSASTTNNPPLVGLRVV